MGVFDFIRNKGSRVLEGDSAEKSESLREAASAAAEAARERAARARKASERKAAQAKKLAVEAKEAAAAKRSAARDAFVERRAEAKKADELEQYVEALGFGDGIDVRYDDGVAYLAGTVADQDVLERVVLAVGNVEGVERVDEDLDVEEPADPAQLYTVKSGDTLGAIAAQFYGDAGRYPEIFEANRPMLTDPDLIYPGQVLRIP